jgi:hypothetical protein
MKSIVVILSVVSTHYVGIIFYSFSLQAILVAVVFSAPAKLNNGNQQIQGFGSPVDDTQFVEPKQFGNNEQVPGAVKSGYKSESETNGQVQRSGNAQFEGSINVQFKVIPSGNNGEFQEVRALSNNGQFPEVRPLSNNGQFQGVVPVVNNGNFPGFRPSTGNTTDEVGHPPKGSSFYTGAPLIGLVRHPGDVTGEPSAFTRAVLVNNNQQGMYYSTYFQYQMIIITFYFSTPW